MQAFMAVQACVCMYVKETDGKRIPDPEVWLNPKRVDKGSTVVGCIKKESYCIFWTDQGDKVTDHTEELLELHPILLYE